MKNANEIAKGIQQMLDGVQVNAGRQNTANLVKVHNFLDAIQNGSLLVIQAPSKQVKDAAATAAEPAPVEATPG